MHWGSVSEFIAMGGYALYVWGAYGVTALLLIVEVWWLVSRRRSSLSSHGGRTAGHYPHADVSEAVHSSDGSER